MKLFHQIITLSLFFSLGLFVVSCSKEESPAQQEIQALSRVASCETMSTEDLDLSDGFRGSSARGATSSDPDYIISGHNPEYDFPPAMIGDGGCSGQCAARVEFTLTGIAPPELNPNSITVDFIQVSYQTNSGAGGMIPAASYVWQYPNLYLNDIITNSLITYEVSFSDNSGQYLLLTDIEMMNGICVIENVDKYDPPKHIIIGHPGEVLGD